MSAIQIHCLSEAISPITHAKGTEGNESLIADELIRTEEGFRAIPILSGNSIRHKAIRRPGAMYLIERMGVRGELSLLQLNYLLHGGSLTENTGKENTARITEMYRLFPLLRLLGGCLPDQVLSGSLHVWRGTLLCRENEGQLHMMLPEGWSVDGLRLHPAHRYVSGYQYTRGDARGYVDWFDALDDLAAERTPTNLMIFSGQAVMRGATFLHGFTLLHPSQLELGALLHALALWAQHGTVGGQAARGHGRLKTVILGKDSSRADAVLAYIDHVERHRGECREWLMDTFAVRSVKKKSKKVAA